MRKETFNQTKASLKTKAEIVKNAIKQQQQKTPHNNSRRISSAHDAL